MSDKQNANPDTVKTDFSRISKMDVTGPERHRVFQSITVLLTVFGSVIGTIISEGFKIGIIGGIIGLIMGAVLMKLFMGNVRNIKRRNLAERTLDSAVSILGSGIFAGTIGGLYGYYFINRDIYLSLLIAISCTIAGAVSTMSAGLAAFLFESLIKRKRQTD